MSTQTYDIEEYQGLSAGSKTKIIRITEVP